MTHNDRVTSSPRDPRGRRPEGDLGTIVSIGGMFAAVLWDGAEGVHWVPLADLKEVPR